MLAPTSRPAVARSPVFDGALHEFIQGLPKAELHMHIEGSITPERKFELAARNKVRLPWRSVEDLRAAQDFGGATPHEVLSQFLKVYYAGVDTLCTERDFHDIAFDYMAACHRDNVRYAEVSFDPQPHVVRGLPFGLVVEGLHAGLRAGCEAFGVRSQLIMCINRERSVTSAHRMLDELAPVRDLVVGIGLDSSEEGNPPIKFLDVYERAEAQGLRLTAHCDVDQNDSVRHIWQCVEQLQVERIDHGLNCLEDPRLMDLLVERGICLTSCPTWRPRDFEPRRVDRTRQMLERGLKVTLNSDDPGVFQSGTLGTLMPPVAACGGFEEAELATLMINAFDGAWIDAADRRAYVDEVQQHLASHLASRITHVTA